MTVIGLDLSIRSTGWAVFTDGRPTSYGTAPARNAADVRALLDAVLGQLRAADVELVAIESTFISVNAKTGIDLAVLRGRLLQSLEGAGVKCALVAPSTWRKTTICPPPKAKRKALKQLSIAYVRDRFGIDVSDDVADAVCLAQHATTTTKESDQ